MIGNATRSIPLSTITAHRDETEPALKQRAAEVVAAKQAIRQVLRGDPERTWTVPELQNAVRSRWTSSIVSLAFLALVDGGEIELGPHLTARSSGVR